MDIACRVLLESRRREANFSLRCWRASGERSSRTKSPSTSYPLRLNLFARTRRRSQGEQSLRTMGLGRVEVDCVSPGFLNLPIRYISLTGVERPVKNSNIFLTDAIVSDNTRDSLIPNTMRFSRRSTEDLLEALGLGGWEEEELGWDEPPLPAIAPPQGRAAIWDSIETSLAERLETPRPSDSSLTFTSSKDEPLRSTCSVQESVTIGGSLTRSEASQKISGKFSLSSSLSKAMRISSRSAEACERFSEPRRDWNVRPAAERMLEHSDSHSALLAVLIRTESNFESAARFRFSKEPRNRKPLIKARTGSDSMTES